MVKRVFILLLDSFGIGASLDAQDYGDEGADTFGHIVEAAEKGDADASFRQGALKIPNLASLGLYHAHLASQGRRLPGVDYNIPLLGQYGYGVEISSGKDTPSGHWEIAGVPVFEPWGYFKPDFPSFPEALVSALCREANIPGILGNCHASGTEIVKQLGDKHVQSGKPICYTSADSVLQIAAHEDIFGLDKLYAICKKARKLVDPYQIGRVIARPFLGSDGQYTRTANRRDYAMPPPKPTLLDRAQEAGLDVIAIGKVSDIFAHQGITENIHAKGNDQIFDVMMDKVRNQQKSSIVFTNLSDFDTEYGHRRDIAGYAHALEKLDQSLPTCFKNLKSGDLLLITADHGCDPTHMGSDHTREHIPILLYGKGVPSRYLGRRETLADMGQSISEYLSLPDCEYGISFIDE